MSAINACLLSAFVPFIPYGPAPPALGAIEMEGMEARVHLLTLVLLFS